MAQIHINNHYLSVQPLTASIHLGAVIKTDDVFARPTVFSSYCLLYINNSQYKSTVPIESIPVEQDSHQRQASNTACKCHRVIQKRP